MANTNLNIAKKEKNDEFYTLLNDIEKELSFYEKHFENKIIYCNCDNPNYSKFWEYFIKNFNRLKIKKIIATYFNNNNSYKLVYDGYNYEKTLLYGNGDFRSDECIEILKQSDIIVTNPPFSLFREYILQLLSYNKQFLIIGNMNAIKYKEIFPYIKENKVWIGVNFVKEFLQPNEEIKKFGNICWFTNLDIERRHIDIPLEKSYITNKTIYPKYDTFNAIDVNKVSLVPYDYFEPMGVPISFIYKHNPNQFEILGELNHGSDNEYDFAKPIINGVEKFPRLVIKRIQK